MRMIPLLLLLVLAACDPTPPPSCRGAVFPFNPSVTHPAVASAVP